MIALKKDAATLVEMKVALGDAYLQPQRPSGIGSTLVKVACNCALLLLRGSLGGAVGPLQFSVGTKGGCDLVQWALLMDLESNGHLSTASLDAMLGWTLLGDAYLTSSQGSPPASAYLDMLPTTRN